MSKLWKFHVAGSSYDVGDCARGTQRQREQPRRRSLGQQAEASAGFTGYCETMSRQIRRTSGTRHGERLVCHSALLRVRADFQSRTTRQPRRKD